MSQTQGQTETLPDAETAFNNIFNGVRARVFFNKCAAAGIAPQNQQEAQYMLETAADLRIARDASVKTAGDENNPFYRMRHGLRNAMAEQGLDHGIKQAQAQNEEFYIKQAALELSQDPTIFNSILALKADEAEAIRKQYTAQQAV